MFTLVSFAGANPTAGGVLFFIPAVVLIIMAVILALVFFHSKKRGKERLERISKKAAVFFLVLTIIFGILGIFGIDPSRRNRQEEIIVDQCSATASKCSIKREKDPEHPCQFCEGQCVDENGDEIFPNAINCCKLAMEEEIYLGSEGEACGK